jgi:quercetin dioxygenase-like cupin family protein
LPVSILPPPDPVDHAFAPLFGAAFASAYTGQPAVADAGALTALRGRLLGRAAASRAAGALMFTARTGRLAASALAVGVGARTLYEAAEPRRPGEPHRARLIDFAAGSRWDGPGTGLQREWLLLKGSVRIGGRPLLARDYRIDPAGVVAGPLVSEQGARLFLRESALPVGAAVSACLVRDADAGWPPYAPGIRRRVLWQAGGQAAMLYLAEPGAAIPLHRHGHDEECLMVQGELFLDDELLQAGDYQLAPAGSSHRLTQTDTGVVIYAHGDLDLQFVA